MADNDEFERILRDALAEHAAEAPDAEMLSRRVLEGVELRAQAAPEATAATGLTAASTRRRAGADRARRRRSVRLLVPLASAACVAAIVAVGLTITHDDHRSSSNSSGLAVTAGESVQKPDAAAAPTGPVPGPASLVPPRSTQSGSVKASSSVRVPASFQVLDLSFDSPATGFALGTLPCASGTGRCSALVRSSSATAWTLVSDKLPFTTAGAAAGSPVVTNIRFATADVGYAFGHTALFMTTNGGVTWVNAHSSADRIEVADGTAVRVVASDGCATTCAFSVSQAQAGTTNFAPISVSGATLTGRGVSLARAGENVYLATTTQTGTDEVLISSTDGGRDWTAHPGDVCGGEPGNTTPAAVTGVAAAADGSVTVLCSATSGSGGPIAGLPQYTVTSTDGGQTFTAGQPIKLGPVTTVASASASTLVVAGSSLYRSVDGGQTWAVVPGLPPGGSTRFLGFQNNEIGRWVGDSDSGASVWQTQDAGVGYSEYTFR